MNQQRAIKTDRIEFDGIVSVGQLRLILSGLPDDTPISDGMHEPLLLTVFPKMADLQQRAVIQ